MEIELSLLPGATLWNALPKDIRRVAFKAGLKAYLFKKAYTPPKELSNT